MKLFKNIMVTSDKHLGDKNLIKATRKRFKNYRDHTDFLAKMHNETIKLHHTLYDLGDLGSDREEIERYFSLIKKPSKMILIKGNHDSFSNDFYLRFFDEVVEHPVFLHSRLLLSHHPIKIDDDIINVHGHTHGIVLDLPNYINVSLDNMDFSFYKLSQVSKKYQEVQKKSKKFCEEWYKDIQRPTNKRSDLVLKENGLIDPEKTIKQVKFEKDLKNFLK